MILKVKQKGTGVKKLDQKGFSVVKSILIFFVIAVLGFAAYFVWNRQKETAQTSTVPRNTVATSTKKTVSKPQSKNGSIDSGFGVMMGFKYPSTWKISSVIEGPMPLNSSEGSTTETIELTSPSGAYKVVYKIGANGGLGGACDPEDGGKIAYLNTKPLQSFSSTVYAETFFENVVAEKRNGTVLKTTTMPSIGLMQADEVNATAVQKSACDIYLADVIKLSDANDVTLIGAKMEIYELSTGAALETFKSKLSGAEYQQAKAILLSTSVI